MQQIFQYRCIDGIDEMLTFSFHADESCVFKDVQMMGDTGLGDVKMICDLTSGEIIRFEEIEDLPSGGVVERFK